MFGLQTPELIVILFLVMLLFGAKKLPELARSMGSSVREYSEAVKGPAQGKDSKKDNGDGDDREAILSAARKLGIETEGRSITEIAQNISKAAGEKGSS